MIYLDIYSDKQYNEIFHVDCKNYDPDKPRMKSIFWNHYDWISEMVQCGKARPVVLENIQKALLCNTIYLGYDGFECLNCDNSNIICHKCHSRFCTSCGIKNQRILAARAESMCLDVPHRHMVFTIPENYRLFFRWDRNALNDLFVAARNTVAKVVNDNIFRKERRKRRKTGKIRNAKDNRYLYRNFKDQKVFGMIATIHTFGRDLKWNPHIHALVPEVVYDPKKKNYKKMSHFHYESLRRTWQYELNRFMIERFGRSFRKFASHSYIHQNKGFYVYAKKPYRSTNQNYQKSESENVNECVNYMMRYASRPAMAESRILSYDKKTDRITWFYDDHTTEERIQVSETGLDLLKKMIIHIPDKHFRCVRYYGFYNPKKEDLLDRMHELIGQKRKIVKDRRTRRQYYEQMCEKLRYRTMIMDTYHRDILKCSCGDTLVYVGTYNPLEGITNDYYYRESCINEMREMRVRRRSP